MIEMLTGSSIHVQAHCVENYKGQKNALLLLGDAEVALPYTIVRLLLPQFRNIIGSDEVDSLLLKHKLITSLFFPQLSSLLTDQEKLEQHVICARLSSNITHNRIAKTSINDTCVELIMELVQAAGAVKIIIPDVRHLDVGSLDVLKLLFKQHPETAPDIVLGFDPDWGKETIDYDNGLVYYSSVDAIINIQAFAYSFQAIADSMHAIETNVQSTHSPDLRDQLDQMEDGIMLKAVDLLASDEFTATHEQNELIMTAIWQSFKLYDFTMALRLAHPFMEKAPDISRKDKGEMYHIIGLSAHNRQFFSQGNENLGRFLERMFKQALVHEENPENRIGALYRLIVTLSRRLNRHEEALEFVDFAISELATNTFDPAHHALLKGWVFNINSFVLMRTNSVDEAIKYHEDAFYLLKDVSSNVEYLNKEIRFTQAVLAENLTTLCSLLNDRTRMKYWCEIEESYSKEWPGLSAVPFAEWQSFYYKGFELTKALENAQKGVQKAAGNFEYILEYFFTMSLADINIRIGKYEDALIYFKKSSLFQSQIAYDFATALSLKIGTALSMLGLANYRETLVYTDSVVSEYQDGSPVDLIEIYIVQAFAYTHLNEFKKAEEAINTAIDLAVEAGNFDQLIYTACRAGDVSQLMGRNEDALNAYEQAKEIMESQTGETSASNMVLVHLGLFEMNQTEIAPLMTAIRNFPLALKTNYALWSHLNRFLTNYLRVADVTRLQLVSSCDSELAIILKVAGQHDECKQNMTRLTRSNAEKIVNKSSRNEL